jgi:hypothetical protein
VNPNIGIRWKFSVCALTLLVVMLRRTHPLCSGKLSDEELRIVDEHRKMLRTDPKVLVLI